jgi:aspartyl-tRNA(Asn)/glutamyl-tRNA(Gln) amidotransferase subunit C
VEITVEDVRKVAQLAKLQLTAEEERAFTDQLGKIVHFVEQLDQVNTENVEPLSSVMGLHSVLRDDLLHSCTERSAALQNAPDHDGECFRVPPVI